MKTVLVFAFLLASLTAFGELKPFKPRLPLNPGEADIRSVGGTNYHVHFLKQWRDAKPGEAQPLPLWRSVRGKVLEVSDGKVICTYEPERVYLPRGQGTSRVGGFGAGADIGLPKPRNRTPNDYGDYFAVLHHPKASQLTSGQLVECFALRTGTLKWNEATISLFDYGSPVKPQ